MLHEVIRWPMKSTVGAAKVHFSERTMNPFSRSMESTSPSVVHVPRYCPITHASRPCT